MCPKCGKEVRVVRTLYKPACPFCFMELPYKEVVLYEPTEKSRDKREDSNG